MKRWQFILCVAVFVFVPLALAAFYQIENWRGARAWTAVKRDLLARNEPLDLSALVPPPVPDQQNLAKAPVIERGVREIYLTAGSSQPVTWSDMPYGRGDNQPKIGKEGWTTARPLPLAEWQEHFAASKQCPHPTQPGTPAADILLAMTVFDPLLDELVRETETRTQALTPINWQQEPATAIQLPVGPLFLKMVTALRLRASAELAAGQSDRALRDALAALRLCDALGREPLWIGLLEDSICTSLALQPVWEGLAARQWTADDLRRIAEALRRDDLLEDYVRTVRGDRILSCATLESFHKSSSYGEAFLGGIGGRPIAPIYEWIAHAMTVAPQGWIDQNKASTSMLYQGYLDAVDLRTRKISLAKQADAAAEVSALNKMPYLIYTLFARVTLPMEAYLLPRVARLQTAREQAEIACALERHFLDHQTYPDTLDLLVPDYLDHVPNDLIDGGPVRYRHTADGRYLLYGIGWNGRDDGGTVAWKPGTSAGYPARPNDEGGDWVWQYAPLDPPAGMP